MTDKELLELAAKAAGFELEDGRQLNPKYYFVRPFDFQGSKVDGWVRWNPLIDDGDRYRLAQKLGLAIDFTECSVWKRLSDPSLIQEYWGGDCGDEAHAVVRAAAEIGKAMP